MYVYSPSYLTISRWEQGSSPLACLELCLSAERGEVRHTYCEWECGVSWRVPASCPAVDVIQSATGDDQEGVRLIFDMTFFFFVIVILLAIIEGDI